MPRRRAFTLIELLVVIAIIGILATLVVTQLGSSRIKARNAQAQSDISEMGKAVESFRNEDMAAEQVISNVPGSIDTLQGNTWNQQSIFTGTQTVSGAMSTYAAAVTKTPSSAYTYRYVSSGTIPGAGGRQLVATPIGSAAYSLCTNLITAVAPYYCATDGNGSSQSSGDQVAGVQELGNLSGAASSGLVAWYKLNGSGTSTMARDSSGNSNTGTLTNFTFDGTTNGWVSGNFANALMFNGLTDYVNLSAPPPNHDWNTPFSIDTWVNLATNRSGGGVTSTVFSMTNGGTTGVVFYANYSAGKDVLALSMGRFSNSINIYGTTDVTNGVWYNVCFTYDGSKTASGVKLYVNGILEAVNIGNDTLTSNWSTNNTIIGADANTGKGRFTGRIDDVRIYSRVLSANEVAQLYAGTL